MPLFSNSSLQLKAPRLVYGYTLKEQRMLVNSTGWLHPSGNRMVRLTYRKPRRIVDLHVCQPERVT